jgi:hypothetical protein
MACRVTILDPGSQTLERDIRLEDEAEALTTADSTASAGRTLL